MVEFSSPNTNKPLHLGHVRNILLGFSVTRILESNGHTVIKTNLVNDRGIHICKSMLAWEKFGNGETPQSSGLKGDHLVGKYYVEFDKAYKKEIAQMIVQGISKEQAEKEAPLMKASQEMLRLWEKGDEKVLPGSFSFSTERKYVLSLTKFPSVLRRQLSLMFCVILKEKWPLGDGI